MNLDDAVATIRASGLAERIDRLLPHLAPSLRIRTTRDPRAGKGLVSRFAGHGVLPRGVAWPEWDCSALYRRWVANSVESAKRPGVSARFWSDQIARFEAMIPDNPKPLHFLAMIRLADIAPYASRVGLADRGTLLFFYDVDRAHGSFWPEAKGGWRILHAPGDADDLVLVEGPAVQVEAFVPSTLHFELQYTLPENLRAETGDDDLGVYWSPDYARVHHALLGGPPEDQVLHQLCGAPQEVQSDLFRQCQLASNGLDCGTPDDSKHPRVAELAPGTKDWRLILQIDSDQPGPGWMWGDVGRLYYCLHKDDLRDLRFERTWCVEQCH